MKPRLSMIPWRPGKWRCVSTEDGTYGPFQCIGTGYSVREAYGKWRRATPAYQRRHVRVLPVPRAAA